MIQPPPPAPSHRTYPWIIVSLAFHVVVAIALSLGQPSLPQPASDLQVDLVTLADEPPPGATTPAPQASQPAATPAVASLPHASPSQPPAEPRAASHPPLPPHAARPTPATPKAAPPALAASDANEPGSIPTGPGALIDPNRLFPSESQIASLPGARPSGRHPATSASGSSNSSPTGSGTGLVPIPEVKKRIQEDAREVVQLDRAARGLVTPQTNRMGNRLEQNWDITLKDVHHWHAPAEVRTEYWTPPGMEAQAPSPPCTYRRFSLATVRITLDRDGVLVSTEIIHSSSSRRMDREVLDLVERASPFEAPAKRDLDQYGHSRSIWDVGARDYSISSCVYLGGKFLVKDIVLVRMD